MSNLQQCVSSLIRKDVRDMNAYHVADASGMLKLDAMENPFEWPGELQQAWSVALAKAEVNRYPDPTAEKLRELLKSVMQIPQGMDVLLGNGSDELIHIILTAVATDSAKVLAPEPGFVMYRIITEALRLQYIGVPLIEGSFELDLPAMLKVIQKEQPEVIFIAYPNNPTANLFSEKDIRLILEASTGIVIVDEAYAPFTDASFMAMLTGYDNLLVMRTVSKMGLAGLRLGYLAGSPLWLNEFDKVRLPYNINTLTQLSARFALEHKDVLDSQTKIIRSERDSMLLSLQQLPGLKVWPSEANFILVKTNPGDAESIFSALKQRNILIKKLHGQPMLDECLRITVGKPEENQTVLNALNEILS